MGGIHPPHPQGPNTPAFDQTLSLELLEREVHGARGAIDPADEFARVELLTRHAGQEREQAGFGSRSLDLRHESMLIQPYQHRIRLFSYRGGGDDVGGA